MQMSGITPNLKHDVVLLSGKQVIVAFLSVYLLIFFAVKYLYHFFTNIDNYVQNPPHNRVVVTLDHRVESK